MQAAFMAARSYSVLLSQLQPLGSKSLSCQIYSILRRRHFDRPTYGSHCSSMCLKRYDSKLEAERMNYGRAIEGSKEGNGHVYIVDV